MDEKPKRRFWRRFILLIVVLAIVAFGAHRFWKPPPSEAAWQHFFEALDEYKNEVPSELVIEILGEPHDTFSILGEDDPYARWKYSRGLFEDPWAVVIKDGKAIGVIDWDINK